MPAYIQEAQFSPVDPADTMDCEGNQSFAEKAQFMSEELVEFVKVRPVAAVGIAAGIGFLLGRAFSR